MLSEFSKFADERPVLEFAQVPFNHPLFIMYSSGTTGPPKCMVHSVGVSRKLGHRVTNGKVQGGGWGHGKRGGLGPVRWKDYMYCMVHSVGVSRKLRHRVTKGKVQGGGGDMGRGVVWGH